MKFKEFLKDRIVTICLLTFGVSTIEIFLSIYNIGIFVKMYVLLILVFGYFIGVFIEYYRKKRAYNYIIHTLNELEEKYLIAELLKSPEFIEEKLLKIILEEIDKSMLENVNKYKYMMEEYKEYIELWIHEIKLPIATSKMIIENNKSSVTKNIDEELDKVEGFIEQALFYARSHVAYKDYIIKKTNLKKVVNESIKKCKNVMIQEKISVQLYDLDLEVYTDSKWIIFIIVQVVQNSVKYMKQEENKKIKIFARQNSENVVLYIVDNGIGIEEGEVSRVFEKGFTGTNRKTAK